MRKTGCRRLQQMLLGGVLLASLYVQADSQQAVFTDADLHAAHELFSGPGEEDLYRTDAMLVSATGSLKPVVLAPSVATVITSERIKAMGARTLAEVLESVPGLHVAPSSNVGPLLTNYTMRGIVTNLNPEVLLLVNGVPVKEYFIGNRGYRFIMPVSMISRIEVVRGPGSALYGADAFAGTINVITKDGHEINGVEAGLRRASFDATDVWLQYGGRHGGWNIAAGFESVHRGSDSNAIIARDFQTDLDAGLNTAASLAPAPMNMDVQLYQFNLALARDKWNLRFWGQQSDDAGLGVGASPVLDPSGYIDSDRYFWDVSYQGHRIAPDWTVDLRLNYSDQQSQNHYVLFPPGALLPIGSDGNVQLDTPVGYTLFSDGLIANPGGVNKTLMFETVAHYDGMARHRLRLAAGHRQIRTRFTETKNFGPGVLDGTQAVVDGSLTDVTGTPYVYAPDTRRRLSYLSAQDEWAFARHWELTAGIRYDDYSDFGSTVNPRLALVWQTRYDLVSKLLYGRAFRAPTIGELRAQNNPVILGNPNLEPETIDTLELAFDYSPTVRLNLKANLFYYAIDGLIEYVDGVAQNARDQKGHGFELEMDWQASDRLELRGNLAWQHAEDKASGMRVANAPGLQAYADMRWQFLPQWSAQAQWIWVGDRKRAFGDNRVDIADYDVVNLVLRRNNLAGSIDLAVGARNVFDRDVREPADAAIGGDYPGEGRTLWAEIRGRF